MALVYSNTCVPFVKARKSSIVLGGECDVYEIIRQIIVEVLRANYNILRQKQLLRIYIYEKLYLSVRVET